MSWWIRTVGTSKLVANPTTSPKGSFEATFVISESWGGYHPVWVNWKPGLDKYGSIRPNEQIFRVLPRINIEPSKGVSGQYVTLLGDGFSTWEYYETWKEGITVPEDFQTNPAVHVIYPNLIWDEGETGQSYSREETGLVLDFGPNQRYVDESHFILNAEVDMEWYINLYCPMKVDAMGTIIYYDTLHDTVGTVGSHFLQVPFLQPGNYEVKVYRFNMRETGKPDHSYSMTESKTVTFTVEKTTVAADLSEIISLLKATNASIIDFLKEIKAEIVGIDGNVAYIKTQIGYINVTLNYLKPVIERIDRNVATIITDLGIIKTDVKNILNNITVVIEPALVRIETKLGTIEGKIDKVANNVITINTTVGKIWAQVQGVDFTKMADNIVTIKTNVGNIVLNVTSLAKQKTADDILSTVQQTPLGLGIAAVLSAIAAIASITAVVVVIKRLKVAA
jgi:hypothetical protein